MKIDELKAELKEIEKGCGKRFNIKRYKIGSKERNAGILGENENCLYDNYCPTCQAKIEVYKKGISACEEAISQRNIEKQEVFQKLGSHEPSHKEILEIIDKFRTQCYGKLNGLDSNLDWWLCIDELITEYLKKQLTNSEDEK